MTLTVTKRLQKGYKKVTIFQNTTNYYIDKGKKVIIYSYMEKKVLIEVSESERQTIDRLRYLASKPDHRIYRQVIRLTKGATDRDWTKKSK